MILVCDHLKPQTLGGIGLFAKKLMLTPHQSNRDPAPVTAAIAM